MMTFCTAVNCIDGRVQRPVSEYLSELFSVDYVDVVTEAGVVGVLAAEPRSEHGTSIYRRIDISLSAHDSKGIGVIAHHDCAGNPKPKSAQLQDLRDSVAVLKSHYPGLAVVAIWVDENWAATELIDPCG